MTLTIMPALPQSPGRNANFPVLLNDVPEVQEKDAEKPAPDMVMRQARDNNVLEWDCIFSPGKTDHPLPRR